MPTAPVGPWLAQALARGLIRGDTLLTSADPAGRLPVRAPAPPPPGCPEKLFQARVIALATANGWAAYHTFDSRRSAAGFPDLVLVRGPVLFLAELKTDKGAASPAQRRWLELLAAVPGVRVRLWRPCHWPAIVAELTAGGAE